MPTPIYIISGLGCDHRVFERLRFGDREVVHITWLRPLHPLESMASYALRLTEQIVHERPIIIGLSFGGMLAMEVAKIIETEQIILLNSAKTASELPPYFRWCGWFGLHKVITKSLIKATWPIGYWVFGLRTESDQALFRSIITDMNDEFMRWAIAAIVLWRNEVSAPNTYHLHGSHDRLLPSYFVRDATVLPGGGHLMLLNRAEEVDAEIEKILANV